MTKTIVTVVACATLLWAGTAVATPTAQQRCDYARITAWKTYVSCVDTAVAKDAKGVMFDESAAFAKCRHTYFKNWTSFQREASLAGSTCTAGVGNRFTVTDSGATVTDALTGLVWELKTNDSSVHNGGGVYIWSTGSPWAESGTAFTTFLTAGLNTPGFAGANGWRVPTNAELQSIVLDFPCTGAFGGSACTCPSNPCVAFSDPNTQSFYYMSATGYVPSPNFAWVVTFGTGGVDGGIGYSFKADGEYVRAVRGGL